jgi:protein-disulfide isomerase
VASAAERVVRRNSSRRSAFGHAGRGPRAANTTTAFFRGATQCTPEKSDDNRPHFGAERHGQVTPRAEESDSGVVFIRYRVEAFRLRPRGFGAFEERRIVTMMESKRPTRARVLFFPICALALGLGAGCKKQDKAAEEAPAAAAAGSEGASGNEGPCGQFITQLCARTGEKSQLCASGKSLGKVLPASACSAAVTDFAQMEKQIEGERKVCADLVERLCKDLGPTTDSCEMVRNETPAFPREQCEELTQNYAQVLGELKQREAQNQPLSAEVQAKLAGSGAPSFGPENAKVTIIEFSDFQCPFCTRAAAVAHQIKEKYGDKVRFVFRQYPLPMHGDAHLAAQASLAAHQQGKFWEYHDLLFANQRALTRSSLEDYGKQANLNVDQLKKVLDDQSLKAAVDADMKLGEEVNVSGTPTLFINGKRVANPTEFAPVAKMIDAALGA